MQRVQRASAWGKQTLRIKAVFYPEAAKYYYGYYMGAEKSGKIDWSEFCPNLAFFGKLCLLDAAVTEPSDKNKHMIADIKDYGFLYESTYLDVTVFNDPVEVRERRYYFYVDDPDWMTKGYL